MRAWRARGCAARRRASRRSLCHRARRQLVTSCTESLLAIAELNKRPSAQLVALYAAVAEPDAQITVGGPGGEAFPSALPARGAAAGSDGSDKALAIFGVLCHRVDEIARQFVGEQRARLGARDEWRGAGGGGGGGGARARGAAGGFATQMRHMGAVALAKGGVCRGAVHGTSPSASS